MATAPGLCEARRSTVHRLRDTLRCTSCGDVVGTYEPAVLVADDHARPTSIAAEPGLDSTAGDLYHEACFRGASVTDG